MRRVQGLGSRVQRAVVVQVERRANTGVSPLRRKSVPPVEMTAFVVGGGKRSLRDTSPFAKAQRVGHPELCEGSGVLVVEEVG